MDYKEYRQRGKEMVDYIADYLENIRDRRVYPDVKPGFMRELLPDKAPEDGEPWDKIFQDVETIVMPGLTHWQSPHMHAYFPALTSAPSMLGDMLADAINCIGFTWASSPACTELETIVMNWLGSMLSLPEQFLHTGPSAPGGGVIQTTTSESTFVALLAARTEAIRRQKNEDEMVSSSTSSRDDYQAIPAADINSRLVAYCSDQAHSSVEKAGLIGLVTLRYIESDDQLSMRVDKLKETIEADKKLHLIPFFVCATLGTTGACAFDILSEIGPVCKAEKMWMHVDAAYAGSAFICPEFRMFLTGIDFADSFTFNPSKWLMVNFDCTAMWVKRSGALHSTFNVDPLYLQHENSGLAIDYMHWQIALSKKFRSLKLWFVLRSFGVKGIQRHIREGVRLALKFETFVKTDTRFEIPAVRHLGLVVFRLKGDNELTEKLLKKMNSGGQIHCVPASLKGKYVIRFTVTSQNTTDEDITKDWGIIKDTATEVLNIYGKEQQLLRENERQQETKDPVKTRRNVPIGDIKVTNPSFGSSLVLSNVRTPNIINASFVGIFEQNDVIKEFTSKLAELKHEAKDSPVMERKLRNLISNRQYSLDTGIDLVETVTSASKKNETNQRPKTVEVGVAKTDDHKFSTGSGTYDNQNGCNGKHHEDSFARCRSKSITLGICNVPPIYDDQPDQTCIAEAICEETSSQESLSEDQSVDICICKECGQLKLESGQA